VAGVDQQHGEAARLQQLEQGNPVDTGGFHRDGVDPAGFEPVSDGVEVDREAGKLAHRFIVSVRRHGHKVGRAADVDAGGVGVGNRQCRSGLAGLEADAAIALGQGACSIVQLRRWRRIGHVV
jgi:hypothetical protein